MEKHILVLKRTEIPSWLCLLVLKYFDCTFVFSRKVKRGEQDFFTIKFKCYISKLCMNGMIRYMSTQDVTPPKEVCIFELESVNLFIHFK